MFIQPIQNTKTQFPAFKSVNITQSPLYPINDGLLISITDDGERGLVKFSQVAIDSDYKREHITSALGHSKDVEKLEDLLTIDYTKIRNRKKLAILRNILLNVVDCFKPALKNELESSTKIIESDKYLDHLDHAIKNKQPVWEKQTKSLHFVSNLIL